MARLPEKNSQKARVKRHLKKYGMITKKQAKKKGINNLPDIIYHLRYWENMEIETIQVRKPYETTYNYEKH